MNDMQEAIRWEIRVPIFKNALIVRQLGIAIGIPFGLVALVICLTSGESIYMLYALGFIAALLVLAWLFIMAAYRGKYEVEFVLDRKGALCRTQTGQARKNRFINALTVALGLLFGKPSAAGAGFLAQARQDVFLGWKRVTKVKYMPQSRAILLRGGWTEHIALFCAEDNYAQVEAEVMHHTKHLAEDGSGA